MFVFSMGNTRTSIAILGSGAGTTAEALMDWAKEAGSCFEIVIVIATKKSAGILGIAESNGLKTKVVTFDSAGQFGSELSDILTAMKIELLVLSGFVRLLPTVVIDAMKGRVINSHPALLPKYGGKGMYGSRVHEAVIGAGEKQSGVTFHWVSSKYDEGTIIYQCEVDVDPEDTVETLENRVKQAELDHFPKVLEQIIPSL